jgi:hypothetical protein
MRVIIEPSPNLCGSFTFLQPRRNGKSLVRDSNGGKAMAKRLMVERPLPRDGAERSTKSQRAARTVSVNLAESPLGWLKARELISLRQFDAGEALRADWERAQLGPRVTMCWDGPPPSKGGRGPREAGSATLVQLSARERFDAAVAAAGPGLTDILWRVVCAGEGMRDAEQALGWPARAGRVVLGLALDRLADHYRL